MIATFRHDWTLALKELHRAADLNPNDVMAHKWLGDVLGFIGRTHRTQELPGAPTDLPAGYHRIVWNTATNRPSCWMNRAGTIIDAFDPNSYT